MVAMGINTGLLMILIFGGSFLGHLKRRLSLANWEEVERKSLEEANELRKEYIQSKVVAGLCFAITALNLLFSISVLSQFQDVVTIILVAILLSLSIRSVLKAWDTRKEVKTFKRKTFSYYIRASLTVGIYSFLTIRLILSIFS